MTGSWQEGKAELLLSDSFLKAFLLGLSGVREAWEEQIPPALLCRSRGVLALLVSSLPSESVQSLVKARHPM